MYGSCCCSCYLVEGLALVMTRLCLFFFLPNYCVIRDVCPVHFLRFNDEQCLGVVWSQFNWMDNLCCVYDLDSVVRSLSC
jgi:hypothetical protein